MRMDNDSKYGPHSKQRERQLGLGIVMRMSLTGVLSFIFSLTFYLRDMEYLWIDMDMDMEMYYFRAHTTKKLISFCT